VAFDHEHLARVSLDGAVDALAIAPSRSTCSGESCHEPVSNVTSRSTRGMRSRSGAL